MSLTLYVKGGVGTTELTKDNKNLKDIDVFEEVVIHSGTWIFYKCKDFNPDRTQESKRLDPKEGREDISTVNGSVYLVPQETQGIILFAHPSYNGFRKVTI